MLSRGASAVTADYVGGGAFGEYMGFTETMRRDPIKGDLHKRAGSGPGIGWNTQDKMWTWNTKWGDQYSAEQTTIRKESVKAKSEKPNTISLRACRLITRILLTRSLQSITNRQAMIIADDAFNRSGSVPGILDAILVQAEFVNATYQSSSQLKKALESSRRQFLDITHQVVLMHELTMDKYPGDISLFPGDETYNLSNMEITDPFPNSRKVLWIRYLRAGDGERFNAAIQVNPDGSFQAQNLRLDMKMDTAAGKVQMSVTRDEFVTCVMCSPLLSECLRRLTLADCPWTRQQKTYPKPLNLDIIIADPAQEAEEEEFMDAMNARQGVVFEIWDYDLAKKDDFLGECWLPPLSMLTAEPRQFVLPVTKAPEDRDPTQSRPDDNKFKDGKAIECTGNLFVEASWRFPHQDVDELVADASLEGRFKKEEAMHTGELYIKVIKATELRLADKKLLGMNILSSNIVGNLGSDPYVWVYVRNEAVGKEDKPVPGIGVGGWKKNSGTALHEPIMKTTWKKSTVNPVWEEEKRILLQTGAFEKRTKRKGFGLGNLDITGRSGQRREDQHAIDVLHGRDDLRIQFRSEEPNKPEQNKDEANRPRHNQLVYMSDTVHQFKAKLRNACREEAEARRTTLNEKSAEEERKLVSQFDEASRGISYRHAVMVFIPSQRLRELSQQMHQYTQSEKSTAFSSKEYEYQRLYRLEEQDPSSWQPLDTIRTFEHYKAMYGFGLELPQRLRIVEGTEEYETKNTRYRQFQEEQKSWSQHVDSLNTEAECFGWAKYTHRNDGGSVEWRQAIVNRPEMAIDGKRTYKTWFINTANSVRAGAVPGQTAKEDLDFEDVLLAPPNARIFASGHAEHQEFLDKAKMLRDTEGFKEAEIAARLNAEMKQRYGRGGAYDVSAVDAITVADVQHVLRRDDMISAQAMPKRAGAFGGSQFTSSMEDDTDVRGLDADGSQFTLG
eukprot:CAMPEP_0183416040 /NCGR_PEP_ID=MMETSP0370-20130417/23512_1 /TAXON_ID=268820 /ORGANISM="Peridinium aciculiferum, Strain PAER-2" /LENGTH=954 /DNA_ID=CAMNT_0025599531 /DNA_START=18 /DNA_END=2883 /DNA_ORIENTATION=+